MGPATAVHGSRRGQSLVELALLLPLLLGMLLGIIDTGMMLADKSSVSYANRQGARLLESFGASQSLNPDPTILLAMIDALKASKIDLNGLQSITIFRADTSAEAQAGDNPAMDLTYTYVNGVQTGSSSSGTAYVYTARNPGDNVGITVRYRYTGFTPLFAGGFTFSDVTSTQIDPADGSFVLPTMVPSPTPPPAAPQPTYTPVPSFTPLPTYTQPPTATPTNTATPTATPVNLVTSSSVVSASSVQNDDSVNYGMRNAVDRSLTTRWSSDYSNSATADAQWIYVDLGSVQNISHVTLAWERACGAHYQIQVATSVDGSGNPTGWTTAYDNAGNTFTCGNAQNSPYYDNISFASTPARFVKMNGISRYSDPVTHPTKWGYSLWEFQVYP